jgi:prepilin-type N-terminal cleavage/methylation domain-containing protein
MMRAHESRGFTLIELMVAVALSGITIALVFGIHGQMTAAFRGQANLSEIIETATAGRDLILREARMAGQGFPQSIPGQHSHGIESPSTANDRWYGLEVINDADGMGTDMLIIRRADGPLYDAGWTNAPPNGRLDLPTADTLGFSAGMLVVMTTGANPGVDPANNPGDVQGCALLVTAVDAGGIDVDATNCSHPTVTPVTVAPLIRIGYRLDPARPTLGVLQRSPTGGAVADWEDMGIGFSTLQFALRRFRGTVAPGADDDGDLDPQYDWYSGENQEGNTNGEPVELGISVEARNVRENEQMRSEGTPAYIDLVLPNNNPLGDWGAACPANPAFDPCGVDLVNIPLGSRPPRYTGNFAYRGTSSRVFLRSRMGSL